MKQGFSLLEIIFVLLLISVVGIGLLHHQLQIAHLVRRNMFSFQNAVKQYNTEECRLYHANC